MKERPILFNTEMVKAILEGHKTQTRRVVKQSILQKANEGLILDGEWASWSPYGKVGDRLYVRETHYRFGMWVKNGKTETGRQKWKFKASKHTAPRIDPPDFIETKKTEKGWFKRPSIFMPRWVSRIMLEITNIRVERVRDIIDKDAVQEGIKSEHNYDGTPGFGYDMGMWYRDYSSKAESAMIQSPTKSFETLWNSINEKRGYGWNVNPWVWVVEFKKI